MRQCAHKRHIFKGLVCGTVGADRDTRMHTADDDRYVVDADSGANLLPIASRRKGGVGGDERNFAVRGHTRGNGRHVLLGDSHLNEPLGECFLEMVRLCRFCQVSGQYDDPLIRLPCFDCAFTETFTRRSGYRIIENICCEFGVGVQHNSRY